MSERQIPLPLSPYHWALLTVRVPMTAVEWDRLLIVLAVMRPALVEEIEPIGTMLVYEKSLPPLIIPEDDGEPVTHHPDCGIHEIGRCTNACGEGAK